MRSIPPYPFRLGTTSYILPADLAPNARHLAGWLGDMELVLFEIEGGPSNFPTPHEIEALRAAADGRGLTYTVHLPLDIRLEADGGEDHFSMRQARRVIQQTLPLQPWAYIVHLDGKEFQTLPVGAVRQPGPELRRWQAHCVQALDRLAGWAGGPERLALENLEGYPLDFLEPILERSPVARCVDVGHLWRDGHDPLPFLEAALARTRVIHWHGVCPDENGIRRDHRSLACAQPEPLERVLAWLAAKAYQGVVTLEVFGEEDLDGSLAALEAAWARL